MIAFLALAVILGAGNAVSVTVNGNEITGPLGAFIGIWGFIFTLVIFFCVGILLAFVLAGVGLIVLGALAFVGIVIAAIAFPFLIPLLIPLFLVWVFCSLAFKLFLK